MPLVASPSSVVISAPWHARDRPDARPDRFAFDEHRAGAALAEAAAKARPAQIEVVAEDVEQRRRRFDVHRMSSSVDGQRDRHRRAAPGFSPAGARPGMSVMQSGAAPGGNQGEGPHPARRGGIMASETAGIRPICIVLPTPSREGYGTGTVTVSLRRQPVHIIKRLLRSGTHGYTHGDRGRNGSCTGTPVAGAPGDD